MSQKDHYAAVLLEDMNGKFDAIMEILIPMQEQVREIPKMKEDITEMKADIRTIKIAVTDTNRDLHKLERRVDVLETHT